MAQTWRNEIVTPGGCFLLALLLLVLPFRWICGWIAAAAVHECFHLLAVRLCGGRIVEVSVGMNGASILATGLSNRQALTCTLAGPIGALLLAQISRFLPVFTVCAVLQSGFNLLPLKGLDGGNSLALAAGIFLPHNRAKMLCKWTSNLCALMLMLGALYFGVLLKLGAMPLLLVGVILGKANLRKTPCNQGVLGVQ